MNTGARTVAAAVSLSFALPGRLSGDFFFRLSTPSAIKKCNSLAVFHVYINEKRDKPMKTARNGAEMKNRKHLLFSPPLLREFQINSIYHPIHSL
jgi:hypothetical protein